MLGTMNFFQRRKKAVESAGVTIPATKEVMTETGKARALDFGADVEQCCAYLKATLLNAKRKGNSVMSCFVTSDATPALWTLLSKAHISGRVWTKEAWLGKMSLFKPLGMMF